MTHAPPSTPDSLARCVLRAARRLHTASGWRTLLPQVLGDAAQSSGAARVAWFDISTASNSADSQRPQVLESAWNALESEQAVESEQKCSCLRHEIGSFERPGLDALAAGQSVRVGHARTCSASGSIFLIPVVARAKLRAILLVQSEGEDPEEEWESLAAVLASCLASEPVGDEKITAALASREAKNEAKSEAKRRQSEPLFRAFIESTSDLICAIDPDGTLFYASPSMERALGWHPTGPLDACLWEFVHEADRERARERIRQLVAPSPQVLEEELEHQSDTKQDFSHSPLPASEMWEMRLRHHEGTWHTFEVTCRDLLHDSAVGGLVLNARDVSSRKVVEEGLLHAALHDRLSGLPNRTLFMDRLRLRVERAKRERFKPAASHSSQVLEGAPGEGFGDEIARESMFAVLFLDFDRFKVINDSLGHMVGDELLKVGARRLEDCLRPGDTVARLGGDEFAILLDEITSQSDAVQVAERIQKALGHSFLLRREEEREASGEALSSTHEVFIAASIGITLGGAEPQAIPYESAGDVLRDADMAMYRAKEKGRARHEIFSSHMHEQAMARLELETDLRRSLEVGDFRVHYQPIIEFGSGLLSGYEALVRWHHPRRGLVAPSEFLQVAEETGMIAPLGWWVLRHACTQLRAWMGGMECAEDSAEGAPKCNLTINVNLSSRQFASDELPDRVRQVLGDTGLHPRNLKLEITESTLITQSAVAARQLRALHEIGVQLGLDDFGTGYSSLAYLHRFPIDSLKIDRSFISALGSVPGDEGHEEAARTASIVSTIINLARQLNLNVIAEGVETPEQALQLRDMDCPMGQGFYFSQPMPHEDAAIFMSGGAGPVLEP